MMKMYDKSIVDYNKYLKLEPNDDKVMCDMGVYYQFLGKFKASIAMFDQAIGLNPGMGLYFLNRSYSFYGAGNKINARADAKQAEKLGTLVPESYKQLIK